MKPVFALLFVLFACVLSIDFDSFRDCRSCVADGFGWCPIRRRCGRFSNRECGEGKRYVAKSLLKTLSSESFYQSVKDPEEVAVVIFHVPDDEDCDKVKEVLEKAALELIGKDKVSFFALNMEDAYDIGIQQGATDLPLVKLYPPVSSRSSLEGVVLSGELLRSPEAIVERISTEFAESFHLLPELEAHVEEFMVVFKAGDMEKAKELVEKLEDMRDSMSLRCGRALYHFDGRRDQIITYYCEVARKTISDGMGFLAMEHNEVQRNIGFLMKGSEERQQAKFYLDVLRLFTNFLMPSSRRK